MSLDSQMALRRSPIVPLTAATKGIKGVRATRVSKVVGGYES
jgi:hypothetical protein